VRDLAELTLVPNPMWPTVQAWVADSPVPVEQLPVERRTGEQCISRLQVTAASTMGALALNCGGILVDHRWLRLYGGSQDPLVDLAVLNGLATPPSGTPPHLVVASDVLGGRFAVNGEGLVGSPGEVCYFGPDTLEWEPLGMGHTDLVRWSLSGKTAEFYQDLRWPGWEHETAPVGPDQAILVYPFLSTAEGRSNIGATKRTVVPRPEIDQLLGFDPPPAPASAIILPH